MVKVSLSYRLLAPSSYRGQSEPYVDSECPVFNPTAEHNRHDCRRLRSKERELGQLTNDIFLTFPLYTPGPLSLSRQGSKTAYYSQIW
jgi:hypothetical protein